MTQDAPILLAARKRALIDRSGLLREAMARDLSAVAPWCAIAEGAWGAARWIARYKFPLGVGLAAMLLWRPRVGLSWLRRAVLVWGACRRAGVACQNWLALWHRLRG